MFFWAGSIVLGTYTFCGSSCFFTYGSTSFSTLGGARASSYDFSDERCFASTVWLLGLFADNINCLTSAISSSIS